MACVAWVDPGRPVPRLTPPFEWASTTGQGLAEALERCAPWVALRRERDAARAAGRDVEAPGGRSSASPTPRDSTRPCSPSSARSPPPAAVRCGWPRTADATRCGRGWGAPRATGFPRRWSPTPRPGRSSSPDARGRWRGRASGCRSLPGERDWGWRSSPSRWRETLPRPWWRRRRRFAVHGAVALLSARRFRALQRLALRDPDSSAYNLAYFTDYATKEIDKARRYGRGFSLLIFSLDGLPHLRARAGVDAGAGRGAGHHPGAGARPARVRRAGQGRRAGVPPPPSGDGPLRGPGLPSPGAGRGARVAGAAGHRGPGAAASAGRGGHLPPRRRGLRPPHRGLPRPAGAAAGLASPAAAARPAGLLGGGGAAPRLARRAEAARGGRGRPLAPGPGPRGALRRGAGGDRPVADPRSEQPGPGVPRRRGGRPVAAAGPGAGARRARLPASGVPPRPADRGRLPGPGLTPLSLAGDERLLRHDFLLWLHGASAYALLQRRGRGATWAFHSSDAALVDGLVSKLQAAYDLQPYCNR